MSNKCTEENSLLITNAENSNQAVGGTYEGSGNAGFIKCVISQTLHGHAAVKPGDGDMCNIRVRQISGPPWQPESTDQESRHCDHGDKELVRIQLKLGYSDSPVPCILGKCLLTMYTGDQCTVGFQLNRSAGPQTCEGERYEFELELLSVERCMRIWTLSATEKFARAEKFKSVGVSLFKDQYVDLSFEKFSSALKILLCMLPEKEIPDDLCERYKILKCQCYANISMCQLIHKSYDFVITNCSKAIALQQDNVKCLYRRAVAYKALKENTNALNDLKLASTLQPNNRSVKEELETVKKLVQEEENAYSQVWSKMLSS